MSSAVSAYTKTLGEDAVPVTYEDIDQADCFLVAGANPAWCHTIIFRRVEARLQAHPEARSEEHTSELQSLMRISDADFCLKKKKNYTTMFTTNTARSALTSQHTHTTVN